MRALLAAAVLCLAGLGVNARQQSSSQQQTGDPVADAARKARAEKKNEAKPKKVYTDDDVNRAAPTPTANTESSGEKPAGDATATVRKDATKPADTEEKEDPDGEKAWRGRFQEQRSKIAKVEREIDVLQREMDKAQTEYYPDPTKAMNEQNTRKDITEKQGKIAAKQAQLEQLKQELSDLEDQLRKSGGDPGWAR
jgi:chromosome segregation ATPase